MLIGNIMLLVINLPLVGVWVSLLRIPYHLLYPVMLAFMCIGAYTMNTRVFDVYLLAIVGFCSYLFIRWKAEPAPLILALVLAPIMEQNFKRALQVSYGDPMVFFSRPISLGLITLTVVVLFLLFLPSLRRTREKAFQE